jgi:hypothetical protein
MTGLAGDTGPIDYDALVTIRDLVLDIEPLVSHHSLGGRLDPRPELSITVDAGFGSSPSGRFDIVWTEANCYHFHYTEPDGIEFRFDRHPEPTVAPKHFHEPPDAVSRVPSCIDVEPPELVTRAVVKCWRTALSQDDPSTLNAHSNPP